MSKPNDSERIEQLEAKIEELTKARGGSEAALLLREVLANQPKPNDPLSMVGISDERKNEMMGLNPDGSNRKPTRWRDIPGIGPSGATFLLHVVESLTYPKQGRVVQLLDYAHPLGAYLHESDGGLIPDGMAIFKDGVSHFTPDGQEPNKEALDPSFLGYRYIEFALKDGNAIIGDGRRGYGEMKLAWCHDPATGLLTPWREGSLVGAAA